MLYSAPIPTKSQGQENLAPTPPAQQQPNPTTSGLQGLAGVLGVLNQPSPLDAGLAQQQYGLNDAAYQYGTQQNQQNYANQQAQLGLSNQSLGLNRQDLSNQFNLGTTQYGLQQQSYGLQQGGLAQQLADINWQHPRDIQSQNAQAAASGSFNTYGNQFAQQGIEHKYQDDISNLNRTKQQLGLQEKGSQAGEQYRQQQFQTAQKQMDIQAQLLGISGTEMKQRYDAAANQLGLDRNNGAMQIALMQEQLLQGQLSGTESQLMQAIISQFGLGR